jgi:hypothetical protein
MYNVRDNEGIERVFQVPVQHSVTGPAVREFVYSGLIAEVIHIRCFLLPPYCTFPWTIEPKISGVWCKGSGSRVGRQRCQA